MLLLRIWVYIRQIPSLSSSFCPTWCRHSRETSCIDHQSLFLTLNCNYKKNPLKIWGLLKRQLGHRLIGQRGSICIAQNQMVTENCLYRKIISWYINCKVEKLQGSTLDLWEAASKWSLWPPCWRNQTRQRIPIVLLWFERMFPPRCRPEMGIRRLTYRHN